jgi:hypothetical protein
MPEGAANHEYDPAKFWVRKDPRMPQTSPESADIAIAMLGDAEGRSDFSLEYLVYALAVSLRGVVI